MARKRQRVQLPPTPLLTLDRVMMNHEVVYQNTKTKGDAAEVEVFIAFRRLGYAVLLPYGENAPYDLIVESPTKKLYRVQVRCAQWKNDSLTLSLRTSSNGKSRPLDRTRIEVFVVWDGTTCYVIPCSDTLGCVAVFTLRKGAPRNGQKKRTRDAAQYANGFNLLP